MNTQTQPKPNPNMTYSEFLQEVIDLYATIKAEIDRDPLSDKYQYGYLCNLIDIQFADYPKKHTKRIKNCINSTMRAAYKVKQAELSDYTLTEHLSKKYDMSYCDRVEMRKKWLEEKLAQAIKKGI